MNSSHELTRHIPAEGADPSGVGDFILGWLFGVENQKKQLSSETQTELFSRKRLLKYDENGFCRKTAVGVQVSTVQT